MSSKVFTKLLGLFVLLLLFQIVVMVVVFHGFVSRTAADALREIVQDAFWSGLIALAVALPAATLVAGRISGRLDRVVSFARRITGGELSARLPSAQHGTDEFSAM